jgi:hypothetical protein
MRNQESLCWNIVDYGLAIRGDVINGVAMVLGIVEPDAADEKRAISRGTGGESGFSGFSPAATAAAIWREGRPFVGWPGASRLFGGRCRAG